MSQGNPLYGEWTLHLQVVHQIADIQTNCCTSFTAVFARKLSALYTFPYGYGRTFASLAQCAALCIPTSERDSSLILVAPWWPAKH